MGQPAARASDMHVCPMVTPAVPPIPHVGGPVMLPGCPTVLIGGMPAARVGDMCVCVGPPLSTSGPSRGSMMPPPDGSPTRLPSPSGDCASSSPEPVLSPIKLKVTVLVPEDAKSGASDGAEFPATIEL